MKRPYITFTIKLVNLRCNRYFIKMENCIHLLHLIFHGLCILSTIICVSRCFYNYQLDLDVSLVEHRYFGDANADVKPAISLCLFDPFLQDVLENKGSKINISDYKRFLHGTYWNDTMLEIDFEKVTKKLEDYILGYALHWNNGSFSILSQNFDKKPYFS